MNLYEIFFQGYHLDFFVHENTESENNKDLVPRLVGYSLMLPVNIGKSKDIRTVPITSLKHKPLGQIQGELKLKMVWLMLENS